MRARLQRHVDDLRDRVHATLRLPPRFDLGSLGRATTDPFAHAELRRHADSWIDLAHLGEQSPPYRPTYGFDGHLNDAHRALATCATFDGVGIDLGVPGWLRREDALKLYELAYFSPGDVLEIGTHKGLSALVIASAIRDAGGGKSLATIDVRTALAREAKHNLRSRGLDAGVRFIVGDAGAVCRRLVDEGRTFALVFVDHEHAYRPVLDVCRTMRALVHPRGFCLLHDFNDSRNADPDEPGYGVAQAAVDGLSGEEFEFHGIFGCSALYRARRAA